MKKSTFTDFDHISRAGAHKFKHTLHGHIHAQALSSHTLTSHQQSLQHSIRIKVLFEWSKKYAAYMHNRSDTVPLYSIMKRNIPIPTMKQNNNNKNINSIHTGTGKSAGDFLNSALMQSHLYVTHIKSCYSFFCVFAHFVVFTSIVFSLHWIITTIHTPNFNDLVFGSGTKK